MCGRLDYYLLLFSKTCEGPNGSSPLTCARDWFWCPLLLAAVLENIDSGHITRNYILPSPELEETYQLSSSMVTGHSEVQPSMAIPFWNLQFSGFWLLRPKNPEQQLDGVQISDMEQLQQLVYGAVFPEDLFPLLQMQSSREKLKRILIQSYLPKEQQT